MGDAPADRVISFELSISNPITLTSNSGNKAAVTVGNNRLEVSHLSGKLEPFAVLTLPQGTYNTADITILNPEMTVLNPNGTQTTFEGATTQTVAVNFSPPLVIGASASSVNIDVNVAGSLSVDGSGNITGFNFSGSSFTFNSKVFAEEDRQQDDDGEVENIRGLVTSVSGGTLSVTVAQTGAQLLFVTDGTTKFSDGATSAVSTLNLMVRIEGVTKSDGTLFAKEVEATEQPGEAELEGLVTRVVGSPAVSLDIVGQDGVGNGMDDSKIGARFTVEVSGVGNSKYRIAKGKLDFGGLQVPGPNFPFHGSTIHPGQRVEVESMTSLPPAQGNVAAEKLTLQQQAVSGTVTNFTSVVGGGQFDLSLPSDGSSYISVLSGQTVVHVFLRAGTDNRVAGIANGTKVRVRGILFWTGSTFNMIARRITQ